MPNTSREERAGAAGQGVDLGCQTLSFQADFGFLFSRSGTDLHPKTRLSEHAAIIIEFRQGVAWWSLLIVLLERIHRDLARSRHYSSGGISQDFPFGSIRHRPSIIESGKRIELILYRNRWCPISNEHMPGTRLCSNPNLRIPSYLAGGAWLFPPCPILYVRVSRHAERKSLYVIDPKHDSSWSLRAALVPLWPLAFLRVEYVFPRTLTPDFGRESGGPKAPEV